MTDDQSVQGISLTIEQFSSLVTFLPEIDSKLRQAGESIPRPDYGASAGEAHAEPDAAAEEKEEGAKSHKKNHEATSDEEEEEGE